MEYVPNMIHSFDSADIDQIAYAIAFAPSVGFGPTPAPPLVLPNPIARYDFNNYTANDPTIADSVPGGSNASINEYTLNTFNTSNASNKYLTIYGPDIDQSQTGGITTPTLSNVTAVEMWVRLDVSAGYGQYFVDFREGATNGYWITTNTGDYAVGPDFNNAKIYFNTVGQVVDSTAGTPSIVQTLYNTGWTQVVLYPSASFTDDLAFFMRYTGIQAIPISVADILVYNAPLNDDIVKGLYNDKCARYGLSPVV